MIYIIILTILISASLIYGNYADKRDMAKVDRMDEEFYNKHKRMAG